MATLLERLKHDNAAAMLKNKQLFPTMYDLAFKTLSTKEFWNTLTIVEAYDLLLILDIKPDISFVRNLADCFLELNEEITLDYSQIADIEVEDIDHRDAPDYCDAYISRATYFGREMTEYEIELLNNDSHFVYDTVISKIY